MVSHSPILLGLPGARILSFDDGEVHPCAYEETESYQVMEMFINSRELHLKKAFERFIKKFIKYPLLFLLKEV